MKRSLLSWLPVVLALMLLPSARSQEQKLSPALTSLIEAERAFARLSVEQGVRAAFLTYFADDGINFQPHPTKTKESLRQRPAPATPPPVTLNWYPLYADVSQAGDLGYTTGPYTFTDHSAQPQPTRYGYYFSIWQRQADGSWKVIVDAGITTPGAPVDALGPTMHPWPTAHPARSKLNLAQERAALLAVDRALLQTEATQGVAAALGPRLTVDARLHRDGRWPVVGQTDVCAYLDSQKWSVNGTPIKADVAQSGDLGYSYGSYKLQDGTRLEQGYYVRVWRRVGDKWLVALDTANVVAPAEKQ
jgi:ketosteroid isomerase-like protein